MAVKFLEVKRFAGISDSEKEGLTSQYLWARSVDYRSDPTKLTILPRTTKSSGSVVVDLPMVGERYSTDMYAYGNAGHIYKKTSADVWSDLRTVASSSGNGLRYFGEDGYLYYPSDKVIGRYGPMSGTPNFADDFLGAEGGVPLNTHSLSLNGTTQYATAADSASLSITDDITLEGYFKLTSLPAVNTSQALISKFNKNGNARSYLFQLSAVAGIFGDGDTGALTISSDTTQSPTDASCSGTAATFSLSATNASFAAAQKILIIQMRGTGVGAWEENEISSYTAGTITTVNALTNTYTDSGASQAQVIVIPEYTSITIDSGKTWSAKAWDGDVGGILVFKCSGTLTVTGTISASGKGFLGGSSVTGVSTGGKQGEGTVGAANTTSISNNDNGGGGGQTAGGGGAGGGLGTAGSDGLRSSVPFSTGGIVAGTADLTTFVLGGGGGSGATGGVGGTSGAGGAGGGGIFGATTTLTVTGSVVSAGTAGSAPSAEGDGGAGSGGSILIKADTATLGTGLITAPGGAGNGASGGDGGAGRIHLDYYTSYTGTTTPTLDVTQDASLGSNIFYRLSFTVSSNGTNEDAMARRLTSIPATATWYHWAVTWDASASQSTFYVDAVSQGSSTGSLTAIADTTALFALGAQFDSAGDAENFFPGKVDEVRVWNDLRTSTELNQYRIVEIAGTSANLQAYYQVDNSTSDSTANANNLSLVASPTYDATDVPFSSPTSRLDLDQSLDTSGQTYTLPTAIDEGATHRQSFVPAKDPQKSVEVLIAAVGTGDWTLTVHDALNRSMASKTVTNANLAVGDFEFTFASVWRPVLGASYHFHVTDTTADGTVTTTTASSLETVDFHAYYQFLVEDDYHPVGLIANLLAIGNERYLATWNGITYNPHRLTLPSGYRIRCLGRWRGYLAIGVTRGTNITDFDQGAIFLWDGVSTTYNDFVDVPQGGINAIVSGDPIYFVAGYSGDFMSYSGGKPRHIRRFPKMTPTKNMEVYPGGMAMWQALVRTGVAGSSDSSVLEKGVYSYGTLIERIEESMSFDYPTSLGVTTGTSLNIGMVFPMGASLFIGWQNSTSYGVDEINPDNAPFATATYESLITDAAKIWGEKSSNAMRGYFKALASGDSFTLKYKIDRNSSWTSGSAVTTAAKKEARLQLPTKGNRFNEFQFAVDLATSNSTSPEFYGLGVEIDDLQEEERV